jgi:VWFA-related protein
LLQDLTSSKQELEAALRLLGTPELQRTNPNGRCSGGSGGSRGSRRPDGRAGGGGTLLYDAVYLASDELMKRQPARKALIILSDGDDRGSKESLETAIESAQRADTVVYSILFKDEEGNGNWGGRGGMGRPGGARRNPQQSRPDGKKVLERLSQQTSGRLFEVTKKQTFSDIYASIERELRNQYSIGYTPASNSGPGYHKINLTTKGKDLVVQARDGYYAER